MGFKRRSFSDSIREIELPSDQKIYEKCETCPIKQKCGGHKEFILEDDSRYCDRECWNCRAVCCKLDDIYERLDEYGGIKFSDIKYDYWDKDWPDFIWVIDEKINYIDNDWYAIPFDHLFNYENNSWNSKEDQKIRYEIKKESNLTVSFCVKDKHLNTFKERSKITELSKKLEDYNFDFLFPVNFSVYRNFPRVDQLLNMKRSLISMSEFFDSGFPSMPNITFIAKKDVERWAKWANKVRLNACMINLQTIKSYTDEFINREIQKIKEFDKSLDWECQYFIAGANVDDIEYIKNELSSVTFINNSAWRKATFYQSPFNDNLKSENINKLEIFKSNKEILKSVCNNSEPNMSENKKNKFGWYDI